MRRVLRFLAALCVAALVLCPTAFAGALEQATVREINQARVEAGLGRVQMHEGLASAAARQSDWMAENNILGHRPDLLDRLRAVAPHQHTWGETLAWMPGSRETLARRTVHAWLRSPPHRAILLDGAMQLVGVAATSVAGAVFVTADFAG